MRDTILSLNISNLSIYIIYINTKDLNKTASISYQIDISEKVYMKNKRIEAKGVIIAIILVLSVSMVVSTKSVNNGAFNASLDDRSGDPIWIYDSDLYIKHVETTDLNGDGIKDVIAAEYDNTYYYESSKIYGLDGTDGSTLWSYQLNDGIRSGF